MKLRFTCGCGGVNYTKNDWFAHWKWGNKYSFSEGIRNFERSCTSLRQQSRFIKETL